MPHGIEEPPTTQLRKVRIKSGQSLLTVATKVGITAATLSLIERGLTKTPTDDVASGLSQYFGKPIKKLLQPV